MTEKTVRTGERLAVSYDITNRGQSDGEQTVELWLDGEVADSEALVLDTGEMGRMSLVTDAFTDEDDDQLYEVEIVTDDRVAQVMTVEVTAIPDAVDNHWPIDEGSGTTLNDQEGSREFTVVGATWDGTDLLFDGTDDYADEPNSDGYFAGLDDFSFFGWANANAFPSEATLAAVYDTGNDERSWEILIENSGENWRLNTSTDGSAVDFATANDSFSAGSWFSFAVTRRASDGQVEFYRDASSLTTDTATSGTLHATTVDARFADRTSGGLNWDGYLKAFAFAKDHIFSSSEVQTLHDRTDPR